MKLHILGSGTGIPHPGRGASGYALVADDGSSCIVECGPGTSRRLPGVGIDVTRVGLVVVTHHHVDHCADLPAIIFARALLGGPATPVTLAGPAGHRAHIAALETLYGFDPDEEDARYRVEELSADGHLSVGPFEVRSALVNHCPGALGLRISCDGRTFVYSGDTGPCEELVALCRGADLALLECSYDASRSTRHHLTTTSAAEIAVRAGIERLALTHFYPSSEGKDLEGEVRLAGYRHPLTLVSDGDTYEV